ncbi:MAG: SDR family oxidoreductase [Alphaproteobacteria bacterium]|nr:MAG: SDR family oxidoreductase [Alphaproteobacteria bacterium]
MTTTHKNALITGAAARLGRAIAKSLAGDGWSIAIHYGQSREAAEDLARELSQKGVTAVPLQADLTREDEVTALAQKARAALGPLTCLVNNASAFENDTLETMTRASWDMHIETNLRAPLVLAQEFARQLPEGEKGNIINMLDQRVWKLTPQFLTYTLSKTGLWTLTQTLAQALGPQIRVNAIGPGPTLKNKRQSDEDFARQIAATPLQRGATPEEIAAGVQFILASPSMTGQMIALDGGQHLIWQTPDVVGLTE